MTDDFFGQDLSLAALAGGSGRIAGVRFVDCELRGPAVVRLGPGFVLASLAEFDLPQEQALLPLTADGPVQADTILLDDCYMDGCRLYGVAFVGPKEQLREQFGDCVFGDERAPYVDARPSPNG